MRCPASTLLPCLVSLAAVAAAQAPTRLEGLVLDPLSQPVANARLTAELDGAVLVETRSDGSGTFVFAKLAWRGVQLRATTDAPDVGVTQLEPAYAPRGVVIVRTMPARRVHGLVRDIAGRPVAGAWVSCTPVSCLALAAAASATLTDENGRYALTHVPYDRVALRVWAADRAGIARELDGATDLEMNLDFSAEAPSVRGFLVRKGTAEQRAAVRCEIAAKTKPPISLLMPEVLRHPAIDADGAYFVRGWPRCDA
ncbi:MAG: carboxypeptidase regulatory-like domain-containing protein, partial [Planctomycetes bacterium]|nr:carboxypeptidase regulatory-like domain-containing protein [Planctomycetota bacterium]